MKKTTGVLKSSLNNRSFKITVMAHLVWLTILCLLVTWWGKLALNQAARIVELEKALGVSENIAHTKWERVQRMLGWEATSFFILLLASTGFLLWLYWRDLKRTRGLQAFFASVTHELRTPLASVRLQAESIAENLAGQDQNQGQTRLVQRLLEDSMRLESQVDKMLDLARIEGGGPVYTRTLQIKPWLDRFSSSWIDRYPGKILVQSQVEDLLVEGDPSAIEVVFKNILENSIKHSQQQKVSVEISSTSKNGGVFILVKDNGSMPPAQQKKLGEIFHKGPSSYGTGVGLYLVKILMGKMGGAVEFNYASGFEVGLWFREGEIR